MRTRSKWLPGPGIEVQSIVSNEEGDWVVSACRASSGTCPDCQRQSTNRHGWSYRSLPDLPVQGKAVTVMRRPGPDMRHGRAAPGHCKDDVPQLGHGETATSYRVLYDRG
ncbi:transposase family protein [Rhizobium leguminosarum]|uniref:transposase family protein n=1 Tax=Rhizobium leguminosarum TaxID=384 RepID=UPI003D7C221F